MNDFSEKIRLKRLAMRLSQERLAAMSGVTLRTIINIEKGRACSVQTLMAVCGALGLQIILKEKRS